VEPDAGQRPPTTLRRNAIADTRARTGSRALRIGPVSGPVWSSGQVFPRQDVVLVVTTTNVGERQPHQITARPVHAVLDAL
jgi:hypothetical protein